MSYSRYTGVILSVLLMLIILPPVNALLPNPGVQIIPEKISANGSFIVKVIPGITGHPLRLEYWTIGIIQGDLADEFRGSIPRIDDTWFCLFSDDPDISTCAPIPYSISTAESGTTVNCYTQYGEYGYGCFNVNMFDEYGNIPEHNSTTVVEIPVGGIYIIPEITIQENNVSIQASTGGVFADVHFAVLNKNLTIFRDYQLMARLESGFYNGNFDIIPGEFYVAFKAQSIDDFGGTVYNLTIPRSAAYFDICPGVTEYGDSVIKVDPVNWNPIINKSKHAEKSSFKITNEGNDTVYNVSVEIPSEISDYIGIELESSKLSGKDYIYFTVTIDEVETSIEFRSIAYLTTNDTRIAAIPLNIMVSVRDACEGFGLVQAPESVIALDSYTWDGTFLTGKTYTKEFTITNNGEEDLKDFNDVIESSLSNVIENITFPNKIEPGESEKITIIIKGKRVKTYFGTIVINTNIGAEKILLGLTFTEDISGNLDSLEYQLNGMEEYLEDAPSDVQGLISDIRTTITSARDYIDSEDYDSAIQEHNEAKFKFEALDELSYVIAAAQETPTSDDGGIIIIIILVVVVIGGAAFAAWYYFTKLKKGGTAFGSESKINNEDELDI